ncbi:RNA polymerase sigma factor [Persicitalea sp.]|uniref:RNA polymerase sigma factor n=1 Tax=Persicitalea sp. TaxID=3100273 RepID=UPI00359371B3
MIKEKRNRADDDLWYSVRGGDEAAFEQLYRRYFQELFNYGKQFLHNEAAINDTIQDLFVDLWRTRRSLSQARSVKYYLMVSLRRKIHRTLRSGPLVETDWETLPETLMPLQPSAEIDFTTKEEKVLQTEKLNAWLDQVPPRQREALILRYYYEMEYAEVADMLDIKEQTSRNLVQKALHRLREVSIVLLITLLGSIL